MSATAVKPAPAERVLLEGVSWRTYESLLDDYAGTGGHRLTYDHGLLEIMSPLPNHERANRLLADIVAIVAEEWEVEVENLGSTTFRRRDRERGFEPDTAFYIRNVQQIAGREEIDLAVDPAPDLVIEVDITHPSLDRLPIFADLGVPEVWRCTAELSVFLLTRDGPAYREQEMSLALPGLSRAALEDLLSRYETGQRLDWVRAVRAWARTNRAESSGGA